MRRAALWSFPEGHYMLNSNQALTWIVFDRDRDRFEREFPMLKLERRSFPAMVRLSDVGRSQFEGLLSGVFDIGCRGGGQNSAPARLGICNPLASDDPKKV